MFLPKPGVHYLHKRGRAVGLQQAVSFLAGKEGAALRYQCSMACALQSIPLMSVSFTCLWCEALHQIIWG